MTVTVSLQSRREVGRSAHAALSSHLVKTGPPCQDWQWLTLGPRRQRHPHQGLWCRLPFAAAPVLRVANCEQLVLPVDLAPA